MQDETRQAYFDNGGTTMTREEAINTIKTWDFLDKDEREAIETLIPELKESKKIKFRKFDIITNGKIEYEIKDIQKNGFGDWIYILYNADIANLLPNDLPDGSIGWICEQVDEQFELKQRMEELMEEKLL
jgi:hypothetical protein